MSVLIKDMEMPTGCDDCPLYGIDLRCNITYTPNYTDGRFVERLGNCPLVEVPPHGDLIDRDTIDYYEVERNGEKHYMVWKPHIDGMPTIIEAEEGND